MSEVYFTSPSTWKQLFSGGVKLRTSQRERFLCTPRSCISRYQPTRQRWAVGRPRQSSAIPSRPVFMARCSAAAKNRPLFRHARPCPYDPTHLNDGRARGFFAGAPLTSSQSTLLLCLWYCLGTPNTVSSLFGCPRPASLC